MKLTEDDLVKKYPFIRGYDLWTGKPATQGTILDDIPEGWTDLVLDMCEEIKVQIEKEGNPNFEVYQAKEKFGALRIYSNGSSEIQNIVHKYVVISSKVCCHCGKPAKWISKGWICPWCDDCKGMTQDDFRLIKE